MIRYLNEVLINSVLGGMFINKDSHDYLFGYIDPYLAGLRDKKPLDGGKPWITGTVSSAEVNNHDIIETLKFTEYDEINTGIFDRSLLRTWKKRLGRNTTGYKYPVFMQDYNITYTWVDTGREIKGTNMLGFHTSVSSDDVLSVFVEDLRRAYEFKYDSDVSFNKLKFTTKDGADYFIGNDTLNGFFAHIVTYLLYRTPTNPILS